MLSGLGFRNKSPGKYLAGYDMTGASLSKTLCVTYDVACWGRLVLKSCMQLLDLPVVGAKQQGKSKGRHCGIMGPHSGNLEPPNR